MSQDRMKKLAIAGIAALLLITMASTLHNAGWSQGFAMGLLAGNADSAQITPYLAYRAGHPFAMGGLFGFFGMMFRFGFFLLFLVLIAKLFGFWRWRMHSHGAPYWGHHGSQHASRHGHGYWGHTEEQRVSKPSSSPPEPEASSPEDRETQNTGWTNI